MRWPGRNRCWPKSSITSCSTPTTKSCARWSPTASCSTSTTATARCWSRRASPRASSPNGSPAAIPGTYVAVHYIKLIDFTFGGRLKSVSCTGQRGHRRPGRRPDLGFDPVAAGLRICRRARSGLRHSHQLGHARQFSRLCRAGSAIPLRQRRVERPQPQAGRRMHDRRANAAGAQDHDEQPLQRHVSRTVGRTRRSAATASKCWSGLPAKWPMVEFGGPAERARRPAGNRRGHRPTTTLRPIGRPWPPCRRWKPSWPDMPPASPTASSKSIIRRGGLVLALARPGVAEVLYAPDLINAPYWGQRDQRSQAKAMDAKTLTHP